MIAAPRASHTVLVLSTPPSTAGLSRFTRGLALFALANVAVVNLLAAALGTPWRDTSLGPVGWFLRGEQGGDSWRPMNEALDFLGEAGPKNKTLYERMFFTPRVKHKGFQYPPTSLLPLYGLRAATGANAQALTEALTWMCVPLTVLAAMALVEAGLGAEAKTNRADRAVRLAAVGILALTFYPTIRAYRNGQAQTWINTLFAFGLYAWTSGRARTAGMAVGAMTLVKPQYVLLLPWAAWRRRWRFLAAGTVVLAAGGLLSIVLFGLGPHLEYLRVLRFIARRGETFYANQSVNGLLNRAFGNGDSVAFGDEMPAYHPWVYAGTLATSLLLIAWAFFGPVAREQRGGTADLCFTAVALTVASPIAWEHHHGVLLPVFAWLLPCVWRHRVFGAATLPLFAAAYVLESHSFIFTNRFAEGVGSVLQSYRLLAAVMVLSLLHRSRSVGDGAEERTVRVGREPR
jgi:alpha-1,2-mannosyltransferase